MLARGGGAPSLKKLTLQSRLSLPPPRRKASCKTYPCLRPDRPRRWPYSACCLSWCCLSIFSPNFFESNSPLVGLLICSAEEKETLGVIPELFSTPIIVEAIIVRFPTAINKDKKNIVLLAVENRQPHIYKWLEGHQKIKNDDNLFRKVDKDGNNALHLAAKMSHQRPWLLPGAALQLQWELKWYEYVKKSIPPNYYGRHNHEGKTPEEIFNRDHMKLSEQAGEWMKDTSQSCSVVAALIATVAFATSATVPGGMKQDLGLPDVGTPTLINKPAFCVFAIASLVALCFSLTSVVMFLAILTSRKQDKDFPNMLLYGLTSLFVSIGAMLLSFCAGHIFVLQEKLRYAAVPMYAVTCLPVTIFAFAQFGLYFDLFKATLKSLPLRSATT